MKLDIQQAINWLEGKLEEEITLQEISNYIRYSSSHTSREFKRYTGSTLRNYIQLRRLTKAAMMLRDHQIRIIDVAVQFGYGSQEAFTRAFVNAFSITPGEYVQTKRMIPYVFKKDVLFPTKIPSKGEIIMVHDSEIKIRFETMPEHKFIYLTRDNVTNYMDFWTLVDQEEGNDCDELHGVLASIPGRYSEGYGAFTANGYLFGKDAAIDYQVDPRYGFQEVIIPEQTYLVFEHPGFTEAEFEMALRQVRRIALEDFDVDIKDYEFDQSFVKAYEHSGMELCYYFIRIPLKSK
ncbi:AraC family transcriptional regulator [Candidatus Xianfuyuplasma coldseepsis]|uniref:AraC family transcriptional regulator n=1 Tax=Candidatus Xianfuyuplasma coldseepsis TaxID=2782163 RepID=A0A7L7KTA7_9MOLU|nr:AraC family transcriptional regulator [Xianfuyuplasma coldseepsis]QMS85845.1 AraC family transcriptional regulator [Xianfuyuplasma coldseepsis]